MICYTSSIIFFIDGVVRFSAGITFLWPVLKSHATVSQLVELVRLRSNSVAKACTIGTELKVVLSKTLLRRISIEVEQNLTCRHSGSFSSYSQKPSLGSFPRSGSLKLMVGSPGLKLPNLLFTPLLLASRSCRYWQGAWIFSYFSALATRNSSSYVSLLIDNPLDRRDTTRLGCRISH